MSARRGLAALMAAPLLVCSLFAPATSQAGQGGGEEQIDVRVVIPDAGTFEVTDAQFRWGVNTEMTSGSFFGGCNFLSAGIAGDAGSSRLWAESDGFYKSKDGNSRIEAPDAGGDWELDSWDTKCQDASGREVGTGYDEPGTGAQVVIEKGKGSVDTARGTAQISWKGSFTLAMYGGLTYWSLSDPVLSVSNGRGKLTATASGYGSDMNDTSKWTKLAETSITMADLPQVVLDKKGIITTPAYKSVATSGTADAAQSRTGDWWGSFPESWIDFNAKTGQAGYWFSTGGKRDAAKVASDVYISYTPQNPVLEKPEANTDNTPEAQDEADGSKQDSNDTSLGGGSSPSETTTTNILQQAAEALGAPLAELPGAGTTVLEAANHTASAINWLGKSLIPEAIERAKDYREPLLWSLAGLLALSSAAWIGFRRGWLVWPFSSKK